MSQHRISKDSRVTCLTFITHQPALPPGSYHGVERLQDTISNTFPEVAHSQSELYLYIYKQPLPGPWAEGWLCLARPVRDPGSSCGCGTVSCFINPMAANGPLHFRDVGTRRDCGIYKCDDTSTATPPSVVNHARRHHPRRHHHHETARDPLAFSPLPRRAFIQPREHGRHTPSQ